MPYFSRLTEIVTCNLSVLLSRNNNSPQFLQGIISEMNQGVAGAERSVGTAMVNIARLETEIGEQRVAAADWMMRAQAALRRQEEGEARLALERKHEVEDLAAGLEQQLQAAIATRDHLATMLCALQARLADAARRLEDLTSPDSSQQQIAECTKTIGLLKTSTVRRSRVESELEQLKKQLQSE